MRCPACGLENTELAVRCDCGRDIPEGGTGIPVQRVGSSLLDIRRWDTLFIAAACAPGWIGMLCAITITVAQRPLTIPVVDGFLRLALWGSLISTPIAVACILFVPKLRVRPLLWLLALPPVGFWVWFVLKIPRLLGIAMGLR